MVAPPSAEILQVRANAAQTCLTKVSELSALCLAACTPSATASADQPSSDAADQPSSDAATETTSDVTSYDGLRKSVRDCIDALEASATKVAVGIEAMSTPEQAGTLLKSFLDPFSHFSTFAFLLIHKPVCTLLERDTHTLVRTVCTVSQEFLSAIVEHRRADVVVSVAKLGELKANSVKLPMSNRAAVKRHCLESMAPIKDTIDEFSEVLADARESGFATMPRDGQQQENESYLEDRFAALDCMDDEELTEAEGRTVGQALLLLGDAKSLVRTITIAVSSVAGSSENVNEHIVWLNEVTEAVSSLVTCISDLGSELYASHDTDELSAAVEQLLVQAKALGEVALGRGQVASLAESKKVTDSIEEAELCVAKHIADVLELIAASERD